METKETFICHPRVFFIERELRFTVHSFPSASPRRLTLSSLSGIHVCRLNIYRAQSVCDGGRSPQKVCVTTQSNSGETPTGSERHYSPAGHSTGRLGRVKEGCRKLLQDTEQQPSFNRSSFVSPLFSYLQIRTRVYAPPRAPAFTLLGQV